MRRPADPIGEALGASVRVLEVGCGPVPHACTTVGLDRDRRAVAALPGDGPVVVVGDASHLPFADGSFDAVLARGVLHHLPDVAAFLGEARRVTTSSGRLLVLDALPMSDDDYRAMTTELHDTGAPTEPSNGVETALLAGAAIAAGGRVVRSRSAGRWTHATPPFTARELTSPASLHLIMWSPGGAA
ncbi:MAG: class I SAM-dependent methyltransferase [Actinomycetota bacterium]|nr:class I SAM-dependent methyltransferase [Actinomycetota bacterium]